MNTRKSHKLLYIPGAISLIMFIPLSFLWLNKLKAFEKVRVMEVNFYEPNLMSPTSLPFPPDRTFINIELAGEQGDERKLDVTHSLIKQIISNNDTTKGIRLHFGDKSRYELFVRALSICEMENVRFYTPYKSDLWICHYNAKYEAVVRNWLPPTCGTPYVMRNLHVAEKIKKTVLLWPSLILLLVLSALSVKKSKL